MNTLGKILLTMTSLGVSGVAMAQAAPPATPIDGGIMVALIATGIALGASKIKSGNK